MLQILAGTGLLYLVRWFWWRVNAWSEVVALISSFAIALFFQVLGKSGMTLKPHEQLLISIIFATVCWLAAAVLGPQTDRDTLVNFYRKVRPFGPGWAPIRVLAADVVEAEAAIGGSHENIPMALLGWVTGCLMIWSSLFSLGNFLYGRLGYASGLLTVLVVCSVVLTRVIRRLWT